MKKFLMTVVLGMFALAGFSQVKWAEFNLQMQQNSD